MSFIPTTIDELGGQSPQFVLISGDAYVDHQSFGHSIIARFVQSKGFSVGIIAQPQVDSDYTKLGRPSVAFLVTSGVIDSMVNNYTAAKKKRNDDSYSEGGKAGKRPDRALEVYCKALRRLYRDTPIIIGGVEASLRRFVHYDYWSDSVMPSILTSTGADLLVYGAGERPLGEILDLVKGGATIADIKNVRGTAYIGNFANLDKRASGALSGSNDGSHILLDDYFTLKCASNKEKYLKTFLKITSCKGAEVGKRFIQKQSSSVYLVVNAPSLPLSESEMDEIYALPFTKEAHPMYKPRTQNDKAQNDKWQNSKGQSNEWQGSQGHSNEAQSSKGHSKEVIPALEEVKFSITSHRGCFGGCSFCSLAAHQGASIQSRSRRSIVAEAKALSEKPDFKGYIHDIGGPSANYYKYSHKEYLEVLREVRALPKVKKVFVRSGVRFDKIVLDSDSAQAFFTELVKHHISGQLKVAPEHTEDRVLRLMNKPPHRVYLEFAKQFKALNAKLKKQDKSHNDKQYLVPYFISAHPGATLDDAINLALYLKSINYMPLQVQDFYPTPFTLSTAMYYTELAPVGLVESGKQFSGKQSAVSGQSSAGGGQSEQQLSDKHSAGGGSAGGGKQSNKTTTEFVKIFVAKSAGDKAVQRALLQYRKPENKDIIIDALGLAKKLHLAEKLAIKVDKNKQLIYNSNRDKKGKRDKKPKNLKGKPKR
ncbi:MAG: DUF3362 domain-containing protein [Firmicutes bacterium]|nr:DUF3362 domain-containing protein [Bacillota bacterium]